MAKEQRPVVAIVDRYTCSRFLLAAFHALGVDVVQAQNRPDLAPAIPDLPYVAQVVGSNAGELAAALVPYAPVAVAVGQEPDVPMTEALAERLGLVGNDPRLSAARRDKHQMIETLRAAGVPCAEQFKCGDAEAIVAWAEERGRYPVVVKPLTSAATDGVAICADAEHVRKAAEGLLGTQTIFGDANEEVLIQSYLEGPEYVVDMVSWQGRRYTCGVWRYHKQLVGGHNIYDHEVLVPPDESPVPEMIAYLDDALRALGVEYGPTHAEVIVTTEGPRLVEVGARLGGNMDPSVHDECLGANQADLTALAYYRPEEFLERYADRRYTKRREALVYLTPTELTGTVERIDQDVVAEIRGLETVRDIVFKVHDGGPIRATVDLHSATMRVFLVGDSMEQIWADYERIRELKDRIAILR